MRSVPGGFDDAAPCWGPTTPACSCATGGRCTGATRDLLRRAKALRRPPLQWGAEVKAVLQAGLDVRDRCQNGELTRRGLDVLRGRLEARLGRLIDAPPPLETPSALKALGRAVFLFLRDPSIDATNWRAEQAIRPAVVIRKVCGGNRTRRGADTQQGCPVWYAPPANVA